MPIIIIAATVILLATITATLDLVKPSIFISNSTKHNIYLYSGESIYGVEPNEEEVEEIMNETPQIIKPNELKRISSSIFGMMKNNTRIDIGWSVGNRQSYYSISSGGQPFTLSSDGRSCKALITIYEKTSVLEEIKRGFCYKRITPFRDTYGHN
jgi:hypothetical protein